MFFLIGALDDLAVDFGWLWLRLTGRARTSRIDRFALQSQPLRNRTAVFIPAWEEAQVIGETVSHMLKVWPQKELRLYLGIYRNDVETLQAAMQAASGDTRLRLVIHDRDGPTTKADCLNRLFDAMRDDERRSGRPFASVVFHDAEDLVDPAGLAMLDHAISSGADFAQLPVEPLPQQGWRWLGSHYCEEFAEAHGKAMVLRGRLGAALPAAGVGCAVSRQALQHLCRRKLDMKPFDLDSLTEDYELGLAVSEAGGRCEFVRARAQDGSLIATRAFFPSQLDTIVRQKTRWVHGVALQGWDRTGWGKGTKEFWMRARDRRGPFTALVLLMGYTLLALTLAIAAAVALGWAEPVELSSGLIALLYANLGFFIWRAAWRFAFTARNYGVREGVFAVLRIPAANVIAIMAGRRALFAYARALSGQGVVWEKTPHLRHPSQFEIANPAVPMTQGALR